MNMKEELYYIKECKKGIQEKLNWNPLPEWKHRDYEALSKLILDKTGTLLSVSTLKRIFKTDYSSVPHPATLDAFASFLGFRNWTDYKMSFNNLELEEPKNTTTKKNKFQYPKRVIVYSFSLLIPIIIIMYILFQPNSTANFSKDIIFKTKKALSVGVPNTVIFNYDIKSAVFDSAFIQQSWDKRRRANIKKEDNFHTSVYYYPGYHKAKLILDSELIKEHNIHIKTDGWQTIVRKTYTDLIPKYIPKKDLNFSESLYASPEVLEKNQFDSSQDRFYVSFYNVSDFGQVYANNFTLEAEIKNSITDGGKVGQYVQMIAMTDNGRIISTFSDKGLVGNISQSFLGKYISGKKNDLSMFGTNLNEWNKVKMEVRDKETRIYLNDNFIFSDSFSKDAGKVIGVHLMFYGCGKAKNIKLNNLKLY